MRALPILLVALAAAPPAAAEVPAVRSLELMSYNVNFGNPDPKASLDAIEREDPDLVLLQETNDAWKRAIDQRLAKRYPHRIYHRPDHRLAGGLAVLSKHPIVDEELWAPPPRTGAMFPAQRLVVDGPLGKLQILNVHLRPAIDGGSWLKGYLTTRSLRRAEIDAHWQRLGHATGALPTIVAGDFNEDPKGRAVEYLAQRGLSRIATTGPRTWHYST
ncbi:MAG: endonuclease/exonuclease/phosphatase family protein, partial [Kofleriaceae bacterium]